MKKHFFGLLMALITFFVSFYVSPIRFIDKGVGSISTADLSYFCKFSIHTSSYFTHTELWSCDYESSEKAREVFGNKLNQAFQIIEPEKEFELPNGKKIYKTILLLRRGNLRFYCLVRADGYFIDEIYSSSLRHVIEFEKQNFSY